MTQPSEQLTKDLERAMKKQKIAHQKAAQGLDEMIAHMRKTQAALMADGESSMADGTAELMSELIVNVKKLDCQEDLKDLQLHLTKFGKCAEKIMIPNITKAHRPISFDSRLLNEAIASHLYRQGKIHIADQFAQEAGLDLPESVKAPFAELHHVLEAIRQKNLEPALQWVASKAQELNAISSDLEFRVHRLMLIHLICEKKAKDALLYARSTLKKFTGSHIDEIQHLMGALPYISRLESSPYADLLSPDLWNDLSYVFARDMCRLLGLPQDSPLHTSICAGTIALPTLLKLASVMAGKSNDWNTSDKLSVEIDLGQTHQYHSVLTCPVSRELTTDDNPPMALVCGHVIAKQSIQKLAKGNMRFKCPYCPTEQNHTQAKQVFL